jgi:DNA-binding GntR family transcriptional regulator
VQLNSETAYYLIKEKIISLELAPSSVIDEQSLMEELGLGRTPIREALRRLSDEALVNIVPRRGMFVADISITDLQEIFEVRIVLAGFCARLAAERATQDQMTRMEAVLRELTQMQDGDSKALMAIDRRFQKLLCGAAGNEFLAETLNRLYDLSLRLWYLVLPRLGDVQDAISQHWEVVEALRMADGARAEMVIQRHIAQFQQRIKAVL